MISDKFDKLSEKRQKIIMEFHKLRATNPKAKPFGLMQQVTKNLRYKRDQHRVSSFVVRVIRDYHSK